MRNWLQDEQLFTPRPFLFVEDRAKDVLEFCDLMKAAPGELLSLCTVIFLDAPGPDAQHACTRMLLEYPALQVIAGPFSPPFGTELSNRVTQLLNHRHAGDDIDNELQNAPPQVRVSALSRFRDIPIEVVQEPTSFAQLLDGAVRPGGAIVCDVEQEQLMFCRGADPKAFYRALREAHDVCVRQKDACGDVPPQEEAQLIIVSGHKYPFGTIRQLHELGLTAIAEGDCMAKGSDLKYLINRLVKCARERFPLSLKMRPPKDRVITHRVGTKDKAIMDRALDMVFWPETNGRHIISGAAVIGEPFANESTGRARVIRLLMQRHLETSQRLLTTNEIDAEFAAANEAPNAARLIFGIRRHLKNADRIIPHGNSGYRLGADARIGLVEEIPTS